MKLSMFKEPVATENHMRIQPRRVIDPEKFRKDRAFLHRTYMRIVEHFKGMGKWDAEDSAFLDLIDARLVAIYQSDGKPVPEEVAQKAPVIEDQASALEEALKASE